MTAITTLSTATYLATWIPDWNSLDSVRRAHSRFELASIVFFGLLAVAEAITHKLKEEKLKHRIDTFGIIFFVIAVLCEGAAYPYSQRNDELSGDVITTLDAKAQHASDTAGAAETKAGTAVVTADKAILSSATAEGHASTAKDKADKAEVRIAAVDKRAGVIDWKLDAAQYLLAPRTVRDPSLLESQLRAFKGKPIVFRSYIIDSDGFFFCENLISAADSAGMVTTDECGRLWIPKPKFPLVNGVQVFAPDEKTMLSLNSAMSATSAFGSGGSIVPKAPIVVFVGLKNQWHVGETAQTRDVEKSAAAMKKAKPPKKR